MSLAALFSDASMQIVRNQINNLNCLDFDVFNDMENEFHRFCEKVRMVITPEKATTWFAEEDQLHRQVVLPTRWSYPIRALMLARCVLATYEMVKSVEECACYLQSKYSIEGLKRNYQQEIETIMGTDLDELEWEYLCNYAATADLCRTMIRKENHITLIHLASSILEGSGRKYITGSRSSRLVRIRKYLLQEICPVPIRHRNRKGKQKSLEDSPSEDLSEEEEEEDANQSISGKKRKSIAGGVTHHLSSSKKEEEERKYEISMQDYFLLLTAKHMLSQFM